MRTIRAWTTLLALVGTLACAGARDPVTHDPLRLDDAHPAWMDSVAVESDGSRMNGIVYVARGAGPHPVVVLLHGLPGDERNLDLAHALRRAGWTVLFFHYRGAWGSQGSFSFGNALADVGAAVALATSDDFAGRFRADGSRVALVGHSMGGFLALTAGSQLDAVDCVAALSPANLGARAGLSGADARALARRLDTLTAPLAGTSGTALVAEIQREGERFDLTGRVPGLLGKPVLLVGGLRDRVTPVAANHDPLVAAFASGGGGRLRARLLDADHAYSSRRIALAREVAGWLGSACATDAQAGGSSASPEGSGGALSQG